VTTLATLKAKIADDLARSDLTTQIATAITSAITYYQPQRFFFTETRASTFLTVVEQSIYDVDDDADIPLFLELDGMTFRDSSGQSYNLPRIDPVEMELLLDGNANIARPYCYAYYESSFRFYPVPDAVYTMRPLGVIEKAAPAADDTAGNVWMVHGYELIRCHAKADLYTNVVRERDKVQDMQEREVMELNRLRNKTTRQVATGRIMATQF
jgi:hypothetical protein